MSIYGIFQDQIGTMARTIKATVSKGTFKEKQKSTNNLLSRLHHLVQEPQHALPDVFLWMIRNNKRVAYQRIPSREILYSMVEEERGKDCAKMLTLFLKVNDIHVSVCVYA